MAHRRCFEALDRTMRDILAVESAANATKPFGGKPIVLGGDFRQILPVVQGGGRNEIIIQIQSVEPCTSTTTYY